MLVKDDEYLQEAAESIYIANADEIVRQQCIARADAERLERTLKRNYQQAKEALEDALAANAAIQAEVEMLRAKITELEKTKQV